MYNYEILLSKKSEKSCFIESYFGVDAGREELNESAG
jgi:hypothetical protein